MIGNESRASGDCPCSESEEKPDPDEISFVCSIGSDIAADYDFCKVYLSL